MPIPGQQTIRCLRVGITGGIGSGKTTACQIFAALGIPVYDADYWAKWLIVNDEGVKLAVIQAVGPKAYRTDGSYDRAYVADTVFRDSAKLALLNAAVHPAVERHSRAWHNQRAKEGVPYTLKEAALMVESGSHRFLDALIVVTAPEPLRVQRVVSRDGVSEQAVRARMQRQMPEGQKVALADFVVINDGRQMLVPQIWAIHQQLLLRVKQVF